MDIILGYTDRILDQNHLNNMKYFITYRKNVQGPFGAEELLKYGMLKRGLREPNSNSIILNDELSFDFNKLDVERLDKEYRYNYNHEEIGNLYYNKAIVDLLQRNYNEIHNNLILGFEHATSDSFLADLFWLYRVGIKESIDKCRDENLVFLLNSYYYYYMESVMREYLVNGNIKDFAIQDSPENYYYAFDNINSYINSEPNYCLGLYFKSLILFAVENYEQGCNALNASLMIKKTSQSFYLLSHFKRKFLGESGLPELYHSILINPSGILAQDLFYRVSGREIYLKGNLENLLVDVFNLRATNMYSKSIIDLFKYGYMSRRWNYYGEYASIDYILMEYFDTLIGEKEAFGVSQLFMDDYLKITIKERELPHERTKYVSFVFYGISENYSDINNAYDSNLDLDQQSPDFWNDIS